jgi:hypothetical protein
MVVSVKDIVKMQVTPEMIERASYTARRKAPNLANTWQERNIFRKYTDLYPGDLAALAVETYLKDRVPKIINYDVYRVESGIDPGFKRPAKWDLLVCNKFYIEVKSSLEKEFDTSNIEEIIKERRIMCYPKREVQIHVQVYYVLEDPSLCVTIETSEFQSYDESDNLLQKLDTAYIMAWATRKDLGGAEVVELVGLTPIEVPRNYRNLYICQGRPVDKLPEALTC